LIRPPASGRAPAGNTEDGSMLVLTRKVGEKIVAKVGEVRIEVEVLECLGSRVRLGVSAPRDVVSVVRGEIETRERSAA
jgi:carbon storage regulator CsrA